MEYTDEEVKLIKLLMEDMSPEKPPPIETPEFTMPKEPLPPAEKYALADPYPLHDPCCVLTAFNDVPKMLNRDSVWFTEIVVLPLLV